MSDSVVSLRKLIDDGEIGPSHGSVFAVHPEKNLRNAVLWAMKHLGVRLPSGINEPLKGEQYIYFGPAGIQPTLVAYYTSPSSSGHLALRSRTPGGVIRAKNWLRKNGFVTLGGYTYDDLEARSRILVSADLGFKIRIDWHKDGPRDRAIVHGSPQGTVNQGRNQLKLEFDPNREPDEEADRQA